MRSVDSDVLIAGGGPAGAAAAIACAERGLSVILVDHGGTPGIRPGETLHPGVEALWRQLGVVENLDAVAGARHPGVWLERGDVRTFQGYGQDWAGPWLGFQVIRRAFDARLLDRARRLGVDVRPQCSMREPLTIDGHASGGITDRGPVRAHILIDATGRSHLLSRKLGVGSERRSPRLLARYGYVEGSSQLHDEAPSLIAEPAGWTWIARVRPGTYQWTQLAVGGQRPHGGSPAPLRGLTRLGPTRGADMSWRIMSEVAGPGWFAVGDAAAVLDPASSQGVLKAIMSGMLAGRLAWGMLRQGTPPAAARAVYQRWYEGWFSSGVDRLKQFYRGLGIVGFV